MGLFHLLTERRFWPLFATLFLAAFNDNVFRNALAILVAYRAMSLAGFNSEQILVALPGLFILPYFLFSATAGQVADKLVKAHVIRYIKTAEIGIMGLAGLGFATGSLPMLLLVLCLMGLHAAFLGPAKFSVLPDLLDDSSLVGGNALVETGTFLAILLGTVAAGTLAFAVADWTAVVGLVVGAIAVVGLAASLFIPTTPPAQPELVIDLNPVTATTGVLRVALSDRTVTLTILGLSWFWSLGAAFLALLPSFAKDVLGGDKPVLTVLLTTFCVGIGIGALLCDRLSYRHLELGLVPLGSIGISLFALDLAFASQLFVGAGSEGLLSLSGFFAVGGAWRIVTDLLLVAVSSGFYTVPLFTLIQQRPDPANRSRVIAGNNIVNSVFIVGSSLFLMALLSVGFEIPAIFLVLALLNVVVAVYIYTVIPEFVLRFIAWGVAHVMYRLHATGEDNIPLNGPAVLAANQVSFVDWLVIASVSARPVRFVIDASFMDNPLIRAVARGAKVIPVPRDSSAETPLETVIEHISGELDRGHLVCVFPEGGLTTDGRLQPFRRGIEAVVRERPVPVIPMAIRGMWGSYFSRRWGRPMSRPFRRVWSRVWVEAGAPIPPAEFSAEVLAVTVADLGGWEPPEPLAIPPASVEPRAVSMDQFFPESFNAR